MLAYVSIPAVEKTAYALRLSGSSDLPSNSSPARAKVSVRERERERERERDKEREVRVCLCACNMGSRPIY